MRLHRGSGRASEFHKDRDCEPRWRGTCPRSHNLPRALDWKTTPGLQTALLPMAAPTPLPGVNGGQPPGAWSEPPGSSPSTTPEALAAAGTPLSPSQISLGTWPRLNLPLSPSCWVCMHNAESEDCNILSHGAPRLDTFPHHPEALP